MCKRVRSVLRYVGLGVRRGGGGQRSQGAEGEGKGGQERVERGEGGQGRGEGEGGERRGGSRCVLTVGGPAWF